MLTRCKKSASCLGNKREKDLNLMDYMTTSLHRQQQSFHYHFDLHCVLIFLGKLPFRGL